MRISQEILKVDVGLMGTENATYKLVDANDSVYEPGLYKPLSSGRQLVYFLIPKDDLFKLITVTPYQAESPSTSTGGQHPKVGNENLVIRYYGITDWLINPDEQGIVVQVRAQNNGTQRPARQPGELHPAGSVGLALQSHAGIRSRGRWTAKSYPTRRLAGLYWHLSPQQTGRSGI